MSDIAATVKPSRHVFKDLSFFKSSNARTLSGIVSLTLMAPFIALLFFGFLYPVAKLISLSFFDPEFTLKHYIKIFQTPLYLKVLFFTLQVAFFVTIGGFLIGYPVAYAMARLRGSWATVIAACVLIPLWTSILVRSYAWIVLLERKGLVNDTLMRAGIIEAPLKLIYTNGAVIAAMIHVMLPFMILPIYSTLKSLPEDLPRAALNLGASQWTVFRTVILPLSLPGVFAGSLMTFILSIGFYVTPALVGGPSTLMMATLIGQQTTALLNWPFAGALSMVLLVTTLGLAVAFRKVLARSKGFGANA